MSVGPLADLGGGLIAGPICVACGCPPIQPGLFTDYGPARAPIPMDCCGPSCPGGGGGGDGGGDGGGGDGDGCCNIGGGGCSHECRCHHPGPLPLAGMGVPVPVDGCGLCLPPGAFGAGSADGSGYAVFLAAIPPGGGPPPECVCCVPPSAPSIPPPPNTAPPPVPGPGSPDSQVVKVIASNVIGNPTLSGLWINCEQSGVTLSAACAAVTFYHPDNNSKTYTTPAGPAVNCTTSLVGTVRAGSASGTPPNAVTIDVRE